MNGEGKGRLETRAEKLVFSYASKLTPELWHLGLSFPLHGEEDLKLKFATDDKGPTIASGPLVKRFEQGLGRARAHQLLKRLGKVMKGLKTARVECEDGGGCSLVASEKIAVVQEDERFELDFGSGPLVMRLVLPASQSGAKWSLMWWDVGEKDPIREQILLFPNDCER